MKRSLIVVLLIAFSILTVIGTTVFANQNETDNRYNLKLIYDNKYVLDEMLNEDSKVIIEFENQTLDDFNISKDEIITLDTLKIPNSKIINYWDIQENEGVYIVSPIIIDKKDVNVQFSITNGGKLIDESALPSITKTVEQGTKLNEITPEVQNEENFYFAGWFTLEDKENEIEIKEDEREDIKELSLELEKKEESLSESEDEDEQKDIEKDIEELQEEIEILKEETLYEIEIVNQYQIVENIGNIELDDDKEYIAVLYPDVNENKKDDRKEVINISIDFGLNNEVHEEVIHVGQPIKLSKLYHEDYIFIDWFVDSEYNEKYDHESILTKDTSIFAQWKTVQEIIRESGNELITEERISDKVESYLNQINKVTYEEQKRESEERQKELNEKFNQEMAQHTEKRYTLKNFKTNQSYLIKFYDNETFLFSVALPYGRTLELLNGSGQKIKEYGIRQESSINLSDLIDNSDNLSFDIKTTKKNNAVITQIYPKNNNKKEID